MTLKKLYILLIVSISLLNMKLYAAPVADNTMGTNVSLPQKLPDGRWESTISGGLLKRGNSLEDGNLFHSFHDFNISQNEVVTFDPSLKVTNILARLTGNTISSIDGELKANANLYLLNPSGFIFKEHTKLDIQGSFYASTADGVNLEGGGKFLVSDPDPKGSPLLTSASPLAFGFLDSPRRGGASIDIQAGNQVGTVEIKNSTFYAPNGLINVTKSNGVLQITDSTFFAPRGEIKITANGGLRMSQSHWLLPLPSEDPSWQGNPFSNFLRKFDVNEDGRFEKDIPVLVPVGTVDVSGWGGGKISILAGQFVLDKAVILADNYGDGQDISTIDINIDGKMQLLNGAKITTDNYVNGYGGNLNIVAGSLQLSGQNPEMIKIDPMCLLATCLSTIAANNSGLVPIVIAANYNLSLYKPTHGIGGNIKINTSTLEITPGLIQSATQTDGAAGNTTIEADKIILDAQDFEVDKVILELKGSIAANTTGTGQGGIIKITAKDKISLNNSRITAQTEDSTGKGGDIVIVTEELNLANNGTIGSQSLETGEGNAGSITITADKAWLTGKSNIFTKAYHAGGGDITLQIRNSLNVEGDSWITAEAGGTKPQDNGGNITIKGNPGKLNGFSLIDSKLLANANRGHGGTIDLYAGKLTVYGDSKINVSSRGGFNGNLFINSFGLNEAAILPHEQIDPGDMPSPNRCAYPSRSENQSRFTITARDILPRCPEDLKRRLFGCGVRTVGSKGWWVGVCL
ncbi:MAG: hypothetical protein BWK78_05650 [Thiotrichaceae bacterium IS1]|nr:MAG: hypothetical protein BWK78_05650 [Thiotrichaceae bacterium IS1]